MNDTILFLVVFISILCFIIFISFLLREEDASSVIYQQCIPGDCAIDLRNGTKICPGNTTDRITANLSYQACTSRNFCTSSQLPFSILKDGSTNSQGICDSDACRCSSFETCSYDRLVSFRDNGDTFSQIFLESQGMYRTRTVNSDSAYCGIHSSSLSKVGCLINNPDNAVININEVATCMNNNFCKSGVAAFYPSNITDFDIFDALYNIPISCVPYFSENLPSEGPLQSPCSETEIAVWNKNAQQIICYSII